MTLLILSCIISFNVYAKQPADFDNLGFQANNIDSVFIHSHQANGNLPESSDCQEITNLNHLWYVDLGPQMVPPFEYGFYLGQDQYMFDTFPDTYLKIEIRYDDGDWILIDENNHVTPMVTPPWADLGSHTMDVRYYKISGDPIEFNFIVHVVPPCDRRFADTNGNRMVLWQGGGTSLDRPCVVVEGFDPIRANNSALYYGLSGSFFDELRDLQVDVIVLDFNDGGADISLNAQVVQSAVNHISSIQTGTEQIILTGLSMGGVACRYALAEAEEENTPLDVSHFVSIDAPQQDAIIDYDFQNYIDEKDDGNKHPALNSPAGKQMLRYNTYNEGGHVHINFYNQLNNLNSNGYPHLTENIGVSFSPNTENPNSGEWLKVNINNTPDKHYYIEAGDPWKEPGSFLPLSSTISYGTGFGGWFSSSWKLERYKNPTFIPHNSALDIVNGVSKFDLPTISSINHNYHDHFTEDVITPIIARLELHPNSITQVTFNNTISGGDDAGGQLRIITSNNQTIVKSSGESENLFANELHNVRSLEQKRSDFYSNGVDYQHINWNENIGRYKLEKQFYGWEDNSVQTAIFAPVDKITIQTELISGGFGGNIKFTDPWFEESDGSQPANPHVYSSPFTPGENPNQEYGGVFLNQNPDPIIPQKPYYSASVPPIQQIPFHGQNIDWYFENWEGSNVQFQHPGQLETAVVFQQPNAVAKACYKGHMVSNELAATSHNGGRHLLIDPIVGNGILKHAVYEDNGKIYYTSYRNDTNPEGWTKELCLSGLTNSFVCSNPSISFYKLDNPWRTIIGVVWEEDYGLGDTRDVVYRILDTGSSPLTWSNSFSISSTTVIPLQPVITPITIAPNNPEFCVMYVESDDYTSRLRFARCLPNLGEYYFSELAENLYEVEGNVLCHPTMTSKVNENKIYFAWEQLVQFSQGGDNAIPSKIHYSILDVNDPASIDLIWSSPGSGVDAKPSIAFNIGYSLDLAWQHYDEENGTGLRHQELLMQETQSEAIIHQVWYEKRNLFSPCLSYSGLNNLTATVQDLNNFLQLNFDGIDWELADDVYPGKGASLCEVDYNINSIYTKHTDGLPYLISQEMLSGTSDKIPDENTHLSETVFREQSFDLEKLNNKKLSGNVSLEIGDIRTMSSNGIQKIPFITFSDTLITGKFQCSQPILVTSEMQKLFFKYKVWLTGFPISNSVPNLPLFRIKLRKLNGQNLKNIMSLQLKEITSSQFYICDSVEVNLQNLVGKEIYLELKSIDHILNSKGLQKIRIHKKIYKNLNELEDRSGKSILANNHSENHIPKKFGLYQNYPNPFNPSTNIKFDLPETSPVKLVIYNLNGQVVKTLVSGQKPAGAHKVVWQGKDDNGVQVASGIYIMQLTAGKHQFSKKLMLLK